MPYVYIIEMNGCEKDLSCNCPFSMIRLIEYTSVSVFDQPNNMLSSIVSRTLVNPESTTDYL